MDEYKTKSLKGLNITFGHSPDADDAFMFFGLAKNKIPTNFKVSHVMDDIESLNNIATLGNLEVTAISAAHYPKVSDHYQIMSSFSVFLLGILAWCIKTMEWNGYEHIGLYKFTTAEHIP